MTDAPVLVVTALGDVTADLVLDELHGRGVPAVRLDPATDFPYAARMSTRLGQGTFTGEVTTKTRRLDLSNVRSVYWRRPSPFGTPNGTPAQRFAIEQSRHGYLGTLHALPGALYVNHPARNRDAENKVLQLSTATRLGFSVPDTLITNVPADAEKFTAEYQSVIYKPVHRVHLACEDGRNRTVWVHPVQADDLDDSIALCPHLFQACVPKTADVRLTMVGDEAFASRIDTAGDHLDWRRDQTLITCTPIPVPGPVRDAARAFLHTFGLRFSAFDFALDAQDRWWFLECNPNGQWAFVDESTTRAIASALADTLEKGDTA
ncbi:ATP-grasp ribosomal peptide maturase [Streptomyces acidiscabies]|uniref:ATP-grasp ribosomal peptide maturase n=1 Tax=Streptomyces acidiscabies TaxID=42234 RepID=A0AAP6BIQ4_9ACTN|nr:ATP-grasp ribosomal peptide maturase [Streptomyces acidiscabies]MBP5938620.1 ATP-grasp ribosomal peptide maturase [Streptomyces sp. LBUM 1476]MBZ3909718.1 ATP-grasp ribosomal peptide maturase [Streptomyces acidiscabies]MDX2965320.1 ATP-grasp ribosomal peptide maturase [Streptomyces acidiscabies]MDX3024611.1 ATP-grasp ribosomal peptide maturase [Streptomyces acidiscabies]MDX3795154.1 ATP-grasp ribosomal peptide maturase [Streptomyces acidiscabies]